VVEPGVALLLQPAGEASRQLGEALLLAGERVEGGRVLVGVDLLRRAKAVVSNLSRVRMMPLLV
jgi:hypothetical protein